MKSTLIIAEVVPFLVLAVGVDNIFFLVHFFNRVRLDSNANTMSLDQVMEYKAYHALNSIAPSIMLATCSEVCCFFLGALTPMPAVRVFAINAATALILAFLFQMLIFVPALIWDCKRQARGQMEIFYCCKVKKESIVEQPSNSPDGLLIEDHTQDDHASGIIDIFFAKVYAPFLMRPYVRLSVVCMFDGELSAFIFFIGDSFSFSLAGYSFPLL